MKELHLTKKDFKIDWFSGTGKGGQYRNKHQNCCRITHLESGITTQSTKHRDRISNQRDAFKKLANILIGLYCIDDKERRVNTDVIRNYHGERNEVLDKVSGLRLPYSLVVEKGDLSEMIHARRETMLLRETE